MPAGPPAQGSLTPHLHKALSCVLLCCDDATPRPQRSRRQPVLHVQCCGVLLLPPPHAVASELLPAKQAHGQPPPLPEQRRCGLGVPAGAAARHVLTPRLPHRLQHLPGCPVARVRQHGCMLRLAHVPGAPAAERHMQPPPPEMRQRAARHLHCANSTAQAHPSHQTMLPCGCLCCVLQRTHLRTLQLHSPATECLAQQQVTPVVCRLVHRASPPLLQCHPLPPGLEAQLLAVATPMHQRPASTWHSIASVRSLKHATCCKTGMQASAQAAVSALCCCS